MRGDRVAGAVALIERHAGHRPQGTPTSRRAATRRALNPRQSPGSAKERHSRSSRQTIRGKWLTARRRVPKYVNSPETARLSNKPLRSQFLKPFVRPPQAPVSFCDEETEIGSARRVLCE